LANYNKTRINIGHQPDRWMELKGLWEFKLMLKCKHQCHCACSSKIGTCIINDAERQAAHTKIKRKYTFYTHVLKVNINFQRKIKKNRNNYQTQRYYTFMGNNILQNYKMKVKLQVSKYNLINMINIGIKKIVCNLNKSC